MRTTKSSSEMKVSERTDDPAVTAPPMSSSPPSSSGSHPRAIPPRQTSLRSPYRRALQFVGDLAILNITFHVTLALRFGAILPETSDRLRGAPWAIYPQLEIFMNLMWIAIAILTKLYSEKRQPHSLEEIRRVVRAALILAASFLLFAVMRGGYNFYSRLFFAYFFVTAPVAMLLFRVVVHSTAATVRSQAQHRKRVVIMGAGKVAERFRRAVEENPAYGYTVLGFLDDGAGSELEQKHRLGSLADLDRIIASTNVDEVIIALPKASEERIAQIITECENRCIRVAVIPNDFSALEGKRTIEQIGDISVVRMREAPLDLWSNRLAKRVFDVAFSLSVLGLVFPVVFFCSALLIKLTSKGSIFFKQLRTGEDGKSFVCYKFRTLRTSDRETSDSLQVSRNDPRQTSIGAFLRRTSLDELPQFWNVLVGDMSVVGPRPHMLKHTEDYRAQISQYMVRHFVKPGVTGWAQVNGYRGSIDRTEMLKRRIEHDLYYIENWSFLLDLTIIGRTIVRVLRGDKNAY